ncbi:hypothetical protein D3C79_719710 [compost metagenome]
MAVIQYQLYATRQHLTIAAHRMAQRITLLVVTAFVDIVVIHHVVGIAVGTSVCPFNMPVDGGWAPFRMAFQPQQVGIVGWHHTRFVFTGDLAVETDR